LRTRWTVKTEQQLDEIESYIAQDNSAAATRVIDEVSDMLADGLAGSLDFIVKVAVLSPIFAGLNNTLNIPA